MQRGQEGGPPVVFEVVVHPFPSMPLDTASTALERLPFVDAAMSALRAMAEADRLDRTRLIFRM